MWLVFIHFIKKSSFLLGFLHNPSVSVRCPSYPKKTYLLWIIKCQGGRSSYWNVLFLKRIAGKLPPVKRGSLLQLCFLRSCFLWCGPVWHHWNFIISAANTWLAFPLILLRKTFFRGEIHRKVNHWRNN